MRSILMILPQEFMAYHGSGIQVRNRLRAILQTGGYRVELLTLPYGLPLDLPGLRLRRVPRLPGSGATIRIGPSLKKAAYDWVLLAAALAAVARRHFDVIYTHEEAGLIGALLKRVCRARHVYEMHSFLPEGMCNYGACRAGSLPWRLVRALQRVILASADEAIAISPRIETSCRLLLPGARVSTIENSFPEGEQEPAAAAVEACVREFNPGRRRVVLYTGNMSEFQGVDLLLGAAPLVCRQVPDAMLLLVGLAPGEVARCREWAAGHGLQEQTGFYGRVPVTRIPALLRMAACLVSPRKAGSNTPYKLYAYMAAGKPIVATEMDAHLSTVSAAEAFLVPREAQAMAAGIVRALDHREEAAARAARARALYQRRFSWRAFSTAVAAVLDRAVEGGA